MTEIKIVCPECKGVVVVTYHTTMGHGATDEALAIDKTIKNHRCQEVKNDLPVLRD